VTIDQIRAAQAEGERFTVIGGPKVAYYFDSAHVERWIDEEGEEDEGVETGMVYMVMIGDDYKHLLDPVDIRLATDYCRVCGQIGCTHDGLER
jgi:hypothetical protein